MHKIAVYGTLRKSGLYDYRMKHSVYLGKQNIKGFRMYSFVDWYPIVVKDKHSNITIEVYKMPEGDFHNTAKMEMSAGYELTTVVTEFGEADLFFMKYKDMNKMKEGIKLIENGDWIKYLRALSEAEESRHVTV